MTCDILVDLSLTHVSFGDTNANPLAPLPPKKCVAYYLKNDRFRNVFSGRFSV